MAAILPQSCERCWRRKQKCARDYPCFQCRAASAPCVGRRLGSVIEDIHAGSTSYIESLKARIHVLQTRIAEGANIAEIGQSGPASGQSQQHDNSSRAEASPTASSPASRSGLQTTMQEASYLSLSAMAERTDKRLSTTEGLSFMTWLHAAIAVQETNTIGSLDANNTSRQPHYSAKGDPPGSETFTRENTEMAFKVYRQFVRHSYAYLTDDVLQTIYNDVLQASETGTILDLAHKSPDKLVIAYLGVATGIALSPAYTYNGSWTTVLSDRIKELLRFVFDSGDDLAMIACLTSLAIYSSFTATGGSTWHILGLAITRCIAIGLHTHEQKEINAEGVENSSPSRALWALFLLDTRLSASLDRPFGLHDDNIVMPSTPTSIADNSQDERLFSHLTQRAKILHSIRRAGNAMLCHFINLRHWREVLVPSEPSIVLHQSQLYTEGLVELFKYCPFDTNPDREMVIQEVERAFNTHLQLFEEYLMSRSGAPSSLDAPHIFAIGVILSRLPHANDTKRAQYQAINILTLLATTYSAVRSLRDILMECLITATDGTSQGLGDGLSDLVRCSEIHVSEQLHAIIFGNKVA